MGYVLRGGTIVDGTGAPRRPGDVRIAGDRIAAAGEVESAAGDVVVDAGGKVVAPGFIDIHTHFDAQVLWDPGFTPSPWHGVTTAVMGNCGFGIAPTRAGDRDAIMETLGVVEGMNVESLRAGIPWSFETMPEYLGVVRELPKRINVAAFCGHTPLRTYVMGHDAAVTRPADEAELASMERLLGEALAAGAVGFASSQSPGHFGPGGTPVPSRLATRAEMERLLAVVGRSAGGVAAITYGLIGVEEAAELSARLGVRITWLAVLTGLHGGPGAAHDLVRVAEAAGGDLWPQMSCLPLSQQMTFASPYYLREVPAFHELLPLGRDERLVRYRDPGWRGWAKEGIASGKPAMYTKTAVQETERFPELVGRRIAEVAASDGRDPLDLMLDVALAEDLRTRFSVVSFNDDEDEVARLLASPRTVVGLSDAGAHVDMVCDAGYTTYLLSRWVRERRALSLEDAVWRLTGQPADLFGFAGRGRIEAGAVADVVVFDPDTIAPQPVERRWDFPGNADHLVAESIGLDAMWVNGVPIRLDGREIAGVHPGELVAS